MPRTTGARAAGICGSLMLAMWALPLTDRLWICVWKALSTWPAVPLNWMVILSAAISLTAKPWLASQPVMVAMSAWAGPNWAPIWAGVSHWW